MKKIIFLFVALILSACAPQATPTSPTSTPTSTSTSVPTPTDEPTPTLTPEPLTLEKLSTMPHEDKINLMLADPDLAGVDANSTFCSEIQDNICVVDAGDEYEYYDLMKEKFVDSKKAGVTMFRLSEAGKELYKNRYGEDISHLEVRSFTDPNELMDYIVENGLPNDEGKERMFVDPGWHPEAYFFYAKLWKQGNFVDKAYEYSEEYGQKADSTGTVLDGISVGLINGYIYTNGAVLISIIDKEGNIQRLIIYDIDVETLEKLF